MAQNEQKTEEITMIRVGVDKRERAKQVVLQISAKEKRGVSLFEVIDTILEEGLARYEKRFRL